MSTGAWIDLAHPISSSAPRVSAFPAPRLSRLMQRPADPMQVSSIELCCHVGTHLDAPSHFIDGAEAIDDLTLDRASGPGTILRCRVDVDAELDVASVAASGEVRAGDVVLIRTDWSAHAGGPIYDRHPHLTEAAAQWLVAAGAKAVVLDFPTPDLPVARRAAGFDWPVHRILLGAGVLIVEHARNLAALAQARIEVACFPLNIAAGDGAPVRLAARELTS